MSDDLSILGPFSGRARLFPLPGFVLFPCVAHPLHIFEPRYRQMTADALADDRLIAMALPRPGWEATYLDRPDIHSVVCLGKIVSDQRLEDGRYNLLLQGLSRARVVEELDTGKPYRVARLELLSSVSTIAGHEDRRLRRHLGEQIPRWFPTQPQLTEQFQKLLTSDVSLGVLGDILGFALPVDAPFKQQLLEELNVERRLHQLLAQMQSSPPSFPPSFSAN